MTATITLRSVFPASSLDVHAIFSDYVSCVSTELYVHSDGPIPYLSNIPLDRCIEYSYTDKEDSGGGSGGSMT